MNTSELFERALARLRRGGTAAVGSAALASGVLLQLPAMTACVDGIDTDSAEQADWAQYEGIRDTSKVAYTSTYWSQCNQPNTRFGCGSVDLWVKLMVKPTIGADLAWKRVGVVYKNASDLTEHTAIGNYFTTYNDGYEEWHVPIRVPAYQTTVLFDAWYQDGAGHTYVDDNNGELHVINDGPAYQVVRVEPWMSNAAVDATGVHGMISLQAYDLDYDKQIAMVATKDNWQTVQWFDIGSAGEKNKWYWVEDTYSNRERWQIDLDLPGAATEFQYAVVYRHGVVNNAHTYEFWDNNYGQNYRLTATPPVN